MRLDYQYLFIGAPYARGTGAVYVVYGRSVWSDVHLNNFTTSQGFVVSGDHKSDCLGISVSKAGDMNKDDYDDVIVGSIETGNYYTGAAYIVLGSSQMPFHRIKYSGGNYFMFAGFSVSSAGDMNGDGELQLLLVDTLLIDHRLCGCINWQPPSKSQFDSHYISSVWFV